jgi:hypothetical protein
VLIAIGTDYSDPAQQSELSFSNALFTSTSVCSDGAERLSDQHWFKYLGSS